MLVGCICLQTSFAKNNDELIIFKHNNQYGFINKKLEVVISPKYDYVSPFSNKGYAIAKNYSTKENFIIDRNGNNVLTFNVKDLDYVIDDLYVSSSENGNGYCIWRLSDKKIIIDNLANTGKAGTAPYILISKYEGSTGEFYIDLEGNPLPFNFNLKNYSYSFNEERAVITREGFSSKDKKDWVITIIDPQGKETTKLDLYRVAQKYSEGLIPVQTKDKTTGYLNLNGTFEFTLPFVCENLPCATNFNNKTAAVKIKDSPSTWVIINNKGKKLSNDLNYEEIKDFSNGVSVVSQINKELGNSLYGVINAKGKVIVPCILQSCSEFTNGYARIKFKDKDGIIDTKGNVYWSDDIILGNTKGQKISIIK